nr:MAG TPA: hypothetical protein [Caudoviricetes sp.]
MSLDALSIAGVASTRMLGIRTTVRSSLRRLWIPS